MNQDIIIIKRIIHVFLIVFIVKKLRIDIVIHVLYTVKHVFLKIFVQFVLEIQESLVKTILNVSVFLDFSMIKYKHVHLVVFCLVVLNVIHPLIAQNVILLYY